MVSPFSVSDNEFADTIFINIGRGSKPRDFSEDTLIGTLDTRYQITNGITFLSKW